MKKILFLLFFIFTLGCKSGYNLPKGEVELKTLVNSKYILKYPKDWKIRRNHTQINSIKIERFNYNTSTNAWFALELDLYKSDEELNKLINDLIDKDLILRSANILSIDHFNSYTEVISTYKIKHSYFKRATRFYKKNNDISQISFFCKGKDSEDFLKYQKIFFDSFKLK